MSFVCKFGGSSLASEKGLRQVMKIMLSDEKNQVCVVSAAGKRFEADEKITDLLYAYSVERSAENWRKISNRYSEMAKRMGVSFEEILENARVSCEGQNEAFVVSRGEYLMARLMSMLLNFRFIDAKTLFLFDENGVLNKRETLKRIRAVVKTEKCVIPGFYGSTEKDEICLFPRGGSDITGALLAQALHADAYYNFTDVDGVFTEDPRFHKNARLIPRITYEEMRRLSLSGARVLHTDAIFPAEEAGIPIWLKNTFRISAEGTQIAKEI